MSLDTHHNGYHQLILKKKQENTCWRGCGETMHPCALLVGTQIGAATVESSVEFPQKIKSGSAL